MHIIPDDNISTYINIAIYRQTCIKLMNNSIRMCIIVCPYTYAHVHVHYAYIQSLYMHACNGHNCIHTCMQKQLEMCTFCTCSCTHIDTHKHSCMHPHMHVDPHSGIHLHVGGHTSVNSTHTLFSAQLEARL